MFCPQCGNETGENQAFCSQCGARLHEAPVAATPESTREKTPWEDRETNGFFGGLFKTAGNALFHPSEFFRRMPVRGGYGDPLLFALIAGMIGMIASYLWQLALKSTVQSVLPAVHAWPTGGVTTAFAAFVAPFLLIAGFFISAGLLHVFLLLVQGARAGYEATFRVVAYAASANLLLLAPFCGGIVSGIWSVVLLLVGLREAHEISGGKAAFAVFMPLVICCGVFALFAVLFMGAMAASFGSMMHWPVKP
jgi:hypothetical protein